MRNELENIEEIERFLLGNMNADEKSLFEIKMRNNSEFAKEVDLQKQLMNQIKIKAFKNEMIAFQSTLSFGSNRKWTNNTFLNSIIAVISVCAVGCLIYVLAFSVTKIKTKITKDKTEIVQNKEIPQETNPTENNVGDTMNKDSVNVLDEDNKVKNDLSNRSVVPVLKLGVTPNDNFPTGFLNSKTENSPPIKLSSDSFVIPFQTQIINSEKVADFQMKDSKSFVHIPANSLEDKNGNIVKGDVEIRYREYRNSAQTAFSGIPMTYSENGDSYNFNSAGMFEIRAFQNGEEVQIVKGKGINIDYNVTEKINECFFFSLDDKSKQWTKRNLINYNQNYRWDGDDFKPNRGGNGGNEMADPYNHLKTGVLIGEIKCGYSGNSLVDKDLRIVIKNKKGVIPSNEFFAEYNTDSNYIIDHVLPGEYTVEIRHVGYRMRKVENVIFKIGQITKLNFSLRPKVVTKKKTVFTKVATVFKKKEVDSLKGIRSSNDLQNYVREIPQGFDPRPEPDFNPVSQFLAGDSIETIVLKGNSNSLLASGADVGHTYPNLVRGLNCEKFGVYNCDQIYLVQDQLSINANYEDEHGKAIKGAYLLSMIDLKFNGAFSFNPSNFTCSKSGRNVLLLFTLDQKIYVLEEEEYKKMKLKDSGKQTFEMKDMTSKLKSSDDLKLFLGLK